VHKVPTDNFAIIRDHENQHEQRDSTPVYKDPSLDNLHASSEQHHNEMLGPIVNQSPPVHAPQSCSIDNMKRGAHPVNPLGLCSNRIIHDHGTM
jgi:hypothetical protein